MKAKVLQENLLKALSNASRFVNTRAQLPVLGNILLKATKSSLLISSTNLETAVSIMVGAQVEKEGEITVPAKAIAEAVANLLPGSLSLQAEKEQLKIESQGSSLQIAGMNSADFPSVPRTIETKGVVTLPREAFLQGLSQVIFAASIDETRPVLTGILFLFKKDSLNMVATDGFRLSQKNISLKGDISRKAIFPKSVLIEAARLASDEEEIRLSYKENENQVIFAFTDTTLSSRVLEGEFPDFEKIIPKEVSANIELDKEDFLRSVKLAAVFARDSANIVKITTKKGAAQIFAESSQSGSQETEIEAKTEGELLEIAFNYRFIEEALGAVKGETVKIALSGVNSPAVFTDPKDPTFIHLIMPVRTQG